jgi:hypothetical protein
MSGKRNMGDARLFRRAQESRPRHPTALNLLKVMIKFTLKVLI